MRTWCWLLQTLLAFSFPYPIPPCALSTVDEKGGQGQWDNQEALPPEKPLESYSVQLFYAPGLSSLALCLPLPLDLPFQLPSQSFPSLQSIGPPSIGLFTMPL